MQINIKNIQVNTITMVGSLNVGKTIVANNNSLLTQRTYPASLAKIQQKK